MATTLSSSAFSEVGRDSGPVVPQMTASKLVSILCCLFAALTPFMESCAGPTSPQIFPDGGREDPETQDLAFAWCRPETELGVYGTVEWPATPLYRISAQPCPFGARQARPGEEDFESHDVAKAYRVCVFSAIFGPKWAFSDYSACKKMGDDERTAASAAAKAEEMTSDPSQIDESTFLMAAELIEKAHSLARMNRTVARSMLMAMSNLVATRPGVQRASDGDGSQRLKLFRMMEAHGRGVVLRREEYPYVQKLPNLHIAVLRVTRRPEADYPDMTFAAEFDGGGSRAAAGDAAVSVHLPAEAFEKAAAGIGNVSADTEFRVRFMAVRNAELLAPPGEYSGLQQIVTAAISLGPQADEQQQLDLDVKGLIKDAVRIQMPLAPLSWGTTHVCGYYDDTGQVWRTDGLKLRVDSQGEDVTCESRHLTPFTLLLDPYPRRNLGDLVFALDVVGYTGSALSVLCLLLTIVTYQFFSRFGEDRWGRVLIQLCLSLLLLHIAYLASNFKGVVPPAGCVAVAIAVHLFMLAAFCWMLVEALLLYQLLVTVFQGAYTKFILKRMLFAWGAPVVLVVICGAVNPKYYLDTHPDFCMVSGADALHHGLVTLLPCCVIMVANIAIFVRIAIVLLRQRRPKGLCSEADRPKVTWAQVRGVIGVAFLLGVTWPLSPLAAEAPWLQLAASAFNSMQGVAIFVSRVLTHSEARRCWQHRLCPKAPDFGSSASYYVSDKGSSWFRLRWSVTSAIATPPPLPKKESELTGCGKPWNILVSSRSRSSVVTSKSSSDTDILY